MRAIRVTPEADRVLLLARTGGGKTTFMLWLVEQLQPCRVIVFDPKEDWEDGAFGVRAARTPVELAAAMHGPVVHYIPASFEREQLEEACQIVWVTPGPYIWVIDELSELTSPSYCPEGLRLCVTQGRKKRKMVIGLTQRLAESHPVFRSQAEHVIVFTPPPVELDMKMIAGAIRREPGPLESELAQLHAEQGDYSHLWYVRPTDELRRCAAIPLDTSSSPAPADDHDLVEGEEVVEGEAAGDGGGGLGAASADEGLG